MEKINYKNRYKKIQASKKFQAAYYNKSLGENILIEGYRCVLYGKDQGNNRKVSAIRLVGIPCTPFTLCVCLL